MGEAKDCPSCGLVNPPNAERCDCGYDFAARRMLGSLITGSPPGCQLCGVQAETRYISFHQNIGVLILRLHSSVQGQLCKACIGISGGRRRRPRSWGGGASSRSS
jgi:hypothetical protein